MKTMTMAPYDFAPQQVSLGAPAAFVGEGAAKAPPRYVEPEPAAAAAVDARHLSKAYGARQVLCDVDLRIAPGEFVALVGRSGCGKSTLLRLIAGLEAADAGSIRLDGASRADDAVGPAADTRIMFQDARLLPWKSVLNNVALGLTARDARQRALDALAQVGLADRADDWPAVLSGGQRQRVALARALVHTPRLLLLDEPLGALDALTRIEMQRLIEGLWLRHGFTALLVTHDVSEAIALADRVLLIENQQMALDERVPLPRPRARGPGFAAHEERILNRVLGLPPIEASQAGERPAHSWRCAV
jgi:sulfonate transport system ATP-binding protein